MKIMGFAIIILAVCLIMMTIQNSELTELNKELLQELEESGVALDGIIEAISEYNKAVKERDDVRFLADKYVDSEIYIQYPDYYISP